MTTVKRQHSLRANDEPLVGTAIRGLTFTLNYGRCDRGCACPCQSALPRGGRLPAATPRTVGGEVLPERWSIARVVGLTESDSSAATKVSRKQPQRPHRIGHIHKDKEAHKCAERLGTSQVV